MDANSLRVMTSSEDHTWQTPKWFFDVVERIFVEKYGGPFDMDVAASAENHLAPKFYTEEDDALSKPWRGRVWCNPPYGEMVPKFLVKAHQESENHGAIVAMLIPSRTDTKYSHDVISKAAEVRAIRGRLKFGESSDSAPFPSVLVIFDRNDREGRFIWWNPREPNLSFEFMRMGVE